MNAFLNHIVTQNKTAVVKEQSLRDGGFAFIKVVSKDEANLYTVSLGSKNIQAFSSYSLQEGTILRVQIRLKENKVFLVPESKEKDLGTNGVHKLTATMLEEGVAPSQITQRFAQMGLPFDAVSLRLINFLQYFGLKVNSSLLSKCRLLASKFSGREKEAGEVALFLAEKGITPDEDNVTLLLNLLMDGVLLDKEMPSHPDKGFSSEKNGKFVLGKLYDSPLESVKSGHGLLTLVNHICSGRLHWITLPYIFSPCAEDYEMCFCGNIRVLMNIEEKKTEKIIVTAESGTNKYCFVLSCYMGKTPKLFYCAKPEMSENLVAKWCNDLEGLFPDFKVSYDKKIMEDPFFCDENFDVFAVNTEV